MKTTKTTKKTRQISYIEPGTGKRITKEVEIPPLADVKSLPCGATVEEIPSMEALTKLWADGVSSDLVTPLTSHSRQILADELKKALDDEGDHQAIDALASTWQPPDDIALKVLRRLGGAVKRQKQKRQESMNNSVQLQHDKDLLEQRVARLAEENKTLHGDVKKVVDERDALRRDLPGRSTRDAKDAREARSALQQLQDDMRCTQVKLTQTETALTEAINARATVEQERDILLRDGERNLEIALNDYESEVVGKLSSVAEEHNEKAKEVAKLTEEVSKLKGERNVLRSRVEEQQNQLQQVKVKKKERDMSENENETVETEVLACGDEVFCKVSGEGPFVLMTEVDEAIVEYSNPISGKRNSFNCGKLPITNAWLVRCKDGSMRTFPAPALTKAKLRSSFSFGGVKSLVTSDVTSKLFQAAIWITILTLLYMQRS